MHPFEEKCIVVINKIYSKVKGKPVIDESGSEIYDLEQEGKVVSSNIDGIKKGMKVIAAFRGGMPIRNLENKKSITVIFEKQDIYATE